MLQRSPDERVWNVMVVDDAHENLRLLATMVSERGWRVRPFADGESALRAAHLDPPDIVLLDVNMPGMGGFEVCRRLKADPRTVEIPVLFVSSLHDTEAKTRAFAVGGVDYITKPFRLEEVDARVRTHVQLHRLKRQLAEHNRSLEDLVVQQVREISNSQLATIVALARLAESRDDDTGAHIERVQALCRLVGEALMGRNPEVDARLVDLVAHASPLHDIGKVGIPDAVLLKPGRLTPDEFRVIQAHTTLGARTLEAVHLVYPRNAFLRVGLDVARSHHERWDGGGYPEGRRGADIPIAARIVAVADVYDALRSRRPYKEPWSHERALATILSDAGRQFDPAVARAFESVEVRCAEARERLGD